MTKITVDRALIEQALEALEIGDNFRPGLARVALRAALAEPAVEPFGYFRAEPFGWTDCAPTDEGAKALYEAPPARPAAEPVKGLFVDLIAQYPGLAEELAAIVIDAPPAEPAVEPVGYLAFRDGKPAWDEACVCEDAVYPVDSDDDRVSVAIYTSPPPPAEPARTSQDVCTVPLLSDEEVGMLTVYGGLHHVDVPLLAEFVRHIETIVRRKAGL